MRRALVAIAVVACGGGGAASPPVAAPVAEPVVIVDASPQIAAARAAWLAGDLAGARATLVAAGADPRAIALIARADALADRHDAFVADLARLASLHLAIAPAVAPDANDIDGGTLSRDGEWLVTRSHDDETGDRLVVWNVVTGRDTFRVDGYAMRIGTSPTTHRAIGVVVPVVGGSEVAAYDLATGQPMWATHGLIGQRLSRGYDVDARGHVFVGDNAGTFYQLDLDTGATLRTYTGSGGLDGNPHVSDDGTALFDSGAFAAFDDATNTVSLVGPRRTSSIADADLARGGSAYAVVDGRQHLVVYARDGTVVADVEGAGTAVRYLPDGTLMTLDVRHGHHYDAAGKHLGDFEIPAGVEPVAGTSFVAGGRGQIVARRGRELVAFATASGRLVEISRFGGDTAATDLKWTGDGKSLTVQDSGSGVATWTVATGDAMPGASAKFDGVLLDLASTKNRLYIYDGGHAVRYVEAPSGTMHTWAHGGPTLVASTRTPTLYIWDYATGQGLGSVEASGINHALDTSPDGTLVAVAVERGGVEIWDLRARVRLATLVVGGGLAAVTDDGRYESTIPGAVVWRAADVDLPIAATAATPGLAASVMRSRPPPVEIAATPPAKDVALGCLPPDVGVNPIYATLAGRLLTYCVGTTDAGPYCFASDVSTDVSTPVAAPLEAFAPEVPSASTAPDVHYPMIKGVGPGFAIVCTSAAACRDVHYTVGDPTNIAISDDGQLFAIDRQPRGDDHLRPHDVDIYDVATDRHLARVPIVYRQRNGRAAPILEVGFLGHTLLSVTTACAGPCAEAALYDRQGKRLGYMAVAGSGGGATLFHDDIYVLKADDDNWFAVQSAATAKVLVHPDKHTNWVSAMSTTRIERVIGGFDNGRESRLVEYNANGTVTRDVPLLRCAK